MVERLWGLLFFCLLFVQVKLRLKCYSGLWFSIILQWQKHDLLQRKGCTGLRGDLICGLWNVVVKNEWRLPHKTTEIQQNSYSCFIKVSSFNTSLRRIQLSIESNLVEWPEKFLNASISDLSDANYLIGFSCFLHQLLVPLPKSTFPWPVMRWTSLSNRISLGFPCDLDLIFQSSCDTSESKFLWLGFNSFDFTYFSVKKIEIRCIFKVIIPNW